MEEKYRVVYNFKDLEDNNHVYLKDVKGKDIYPREGLKPSKVRIKELSTTKNKLGKILIEKIEEVQNQEIEKDEETEYKE